MRWLFVALNEAGVNLFSHSSEKDEIPSSTCGTFHSSSLLSGVLYAIFESALNKGLNMNFLRSDGSFITMVDIKSKIFLL